MNPVTTGTCPAATNGSYDVEAIRRQEVWRAHNLAVWGAEEFADTPESVAVRLMDRGIRHEVAERRFRVQRDEFEAYPAVRFTAGGHEVDATIFPRDGIRQAPSSPVDGKPMRRATLPPRSAGR